MLFSFMSGWNVSTCYAIHKLHAIADYRWRLAVYWAVKLLIIVRTAYI